MKIHPLAGHVAPVEILINVAKLVTAYYSERPDPSEAAHRVAFGTSGHRGSSLKRSFNEYHLLAMTQAICDYRQANNIDGPLFIGIDTHALSEPAFVSAMEVLAANDVQVQISTGGEYVPTPAISHAILTYNQERTRGLADGIVITPSHNPPDGGGFKYNPTHGGPADTHITNWVERRSNHYLEAGLKAVKRIPFEQAMRASTTHEYDFLRHYVADIANVIDMEAIRAAGVRMAVNPLGGAGVNYWPAIAEKYQLDLTVLNSTVDTSFRFMSVDWDGKIRMDPSSPYAMQGLINLKDSYDVAFACDTDHDRHGIVSASAGLIAPNHYLCVAIDYLFQNRPHWSLNAAVGKTLVSSQMIDRVSTGIGRKVLEVPVGFKWFAAGLVDGSLGFGGEESAGASFLRRDGRVWTTDKDGLAPALLSAEITAKTGRDPGENYQALIKKYGEPTADRIQAVASTEQKAKLSQLSPEQVTSTTLAGETITAVMTKAPGNNAAIGGLKVVTENGWFAARPSGTEDIYKIYGESFRGEAHLQTILKEAQAIVDKALK
ncbi:phosphoglucomutase (alpha-D-glucose-1,6-bisphosphate-dependent) [Marinagarivorans algicola]|uniref:phosphoglucomutase (alpha-D-glucose-1,6-bisphosphate-dependent) n=1 Tax=Marinagarivorans algicola TaxID=1513270 RepID=UPI0006B8AC71|nr:phosphoglucomutase (alpha-D-glucose-1,6-bisphosphate-dependent) [Marinagarivorans algicola]